MASNTVSTTGSTRSDMGSTTVLTGVLKDVYLKGMTNTIYFNNDFTRLIQPQTAKMDATGRRIIQAFDIGRSSGVGPIAEGGAFRDSVPIDATQGYEWLKYDNALFSLTGPAIATVKAGEGSYVDIVSKHMTSMIQSGKMRIERVLMGANDAYLGDIGSGSTLTSGSVMNVDGPAFYDTQFFEPGMHIEFHDEGAWGTELVYDNSSAYTSTVASITKGSKKTGSTTAGTVTIAGTFSGGSLTVGDYIARKYSYTGTTCLDANGLMNLISDGATNCGYYQGAETRNN